MRGWVRRRSAGASRQLGRWGDRHAAGRAGRARVAGGRHGRVAGRCEGRWGASAAGRRARGKQAAAGAGARGACGAGLAGRQARGLGARVVHSVHLAHFRSVLTRYFPESNFLDIVREPGS